MVKTSESKENLVPSSSSDVEANVPDRKVAKPVDPAEYVLTQTDKKFLLIAERGDLAGVKR